MYSSDESFQRSQEGYFGVYFSSCEATREINTKITLERAQKPLKLSPLKPRCLVLIDQYLSNITANMYLVHQSFMWFMCLKGLLQMISKCWPIVTSWTWDGHWQLWSHNDRLFSRGFYGRFLITMAEPSFIMERLCGSINCLASEVIINWQRVIRITWIKALIILQWRDSMRTMYSFST